MKTIFGVLDSTSKNCFQTKREWFCERIRHCAPAPILVRIGAPLSGFSKNQLFNYGDSIFCLAVPCAGMIRMIHPTRTTRTTNRTRETTILLSILGLLFIAFAAVLTLKLAAPRPPMGSGPDVHLAQSHSSGHTLVEPPSLPPSVPEDISLERSTSRFSTLATAPSFRDNQEQTRSVAPYERSAPEIPEVPSDKPRENSIAKNRGDSNRNPLDDAGQMPDVIRTSLGVPEVSSGDIPHQPSVLEPADSWWSLAERHYGDGRFYKALYAWNRTTNPRVTLAHGKDIEIPSKLDLEYAWPALLPREPLLSSETESDSTHTVKDGDTLMSIARSRLGSSDQWRLLYDTNRRSLGNQPGPLAPGIVLTLPTNEFIRQSSQSLTRESDLDLLDIPITRP